MSPGPTAPLWVRTLTRPVIRRWLQLDVSGTHHVSRSGPVILAPVHRSYADIPAVAAALDRPLTFLGSAHLSEIPVAGWILPRLGLITVRRGEGDQAALDRCLAILGGGGALVVFPEGGRARDGLIHPPRSGVGRLAAIAGCPVVPVGIIGSDAAWPPDGRPALRGLHVAVRFGEPLEPPSHDVGSRRSFGIALQDALVTLSGARPSPSLLSVYA